MKTLIIHPYDKTTEFLKSSYESLSDCFVVNQNISKSSLRRLVYQHDRIIMLGHGTKDGLLGFNRFVIDSTFVQHLRTKICIAVWCNANEFFWKYKLKGFYTGMIISELDEAYTYCLHNNFTYKDVEESNQLLTNSLQTALKLDVTEMLKSMRSTYHSETNSIVQFNQENFYLTLS